MLKDNIAKCATRNKGCRGGYISKDAAEKKDRTPMCPTCRNVAHEAIMAVLRGKRQFDSLSLVKAAVGFMMSRKSGWVQSFVDHIDNVDDDAWKAWWRTNVVGDDPGRPSCRRFFDTVAEQYVSKLPDPHQGLTQRMEIPDLPVAPSGEKPVETPAEEPAPEPKLEEPQPEAQMPVKKKRATKTTQDAPAPKGAVVKVSSKKPLTPMQQATKNAKEAAKEAERQAKEALK